VRQLRENVEQYTGPSTAHVTFGRRPRRPDRGAGADAGREAEAGRGWPGLLRGRWRRDDRESLVCYALYAGVFVADMSLLALAFPAALYLYALLVNPPSPRFWQARALLYITFSILPGYLVYHTLCYHTLFQYIRRKVNAGARVAAAHPLRCACGYAQARPGRDHL